MNPYSVGNNSPDLILLTNSDRFPENTPTIPLIRAVCSGSSDEATSGSMCVQALPGKGDQYWHGTFQA